MDERYWGLLASIDLHDCDHEDIMNPEKIKEFVKQLCEVIGMKRHGDTIVERFGDGDLYGYSMFQFLETSSITGHFDDIFNRAFIDIFSCKEFDAEKAREFAKEFFKAKDCKVRIIERK